MSEQAYQVDEGAGGVISPQVAIAESLKPISSPNELPPELTWVTEWPEATPGHLATLMTVDGRQVLHFFPAIEVVVNGAKTDCLLPAGVLESITVAPGRRSLLSDPATNLLLVLGAQERMIWDSWLPAGSDVLPVGLQSGASGAVPVGVVALLNVRAKVVVSLPLDHRSDRDTWERADSLRRLADTKGAKVSFVELPLKDMSFAQLVESLPVSERSATLVGLLSTASDKLPARPAKGSNGGASRSDATTTAEVDWGAGTIHFPDAADPMLGASVPGEVLCAAAAKIVSTTTVHDDLRPEAPKVIEHALAVKLEGETREYRVAGITDGQLGDANFWGGQAAGGKGATVLRSARHGAKDEIAVAIQAHATGEPPEQLTAIARTGLHAAPDGVCWAFPGGAMTPDGIRHDIFSRLAVASYRRISVPKPDDAKLVDAWRRTLGIAEWLSPANQAALYAVLGAMMWAAAGPDGAHQSGIYVDGQGGSGKSLLLRTLSTAYGPSFRYSGGVAMATFEGTAGVTRELGAGCHHMAFFADDARPRPDEREAVIQESASMLLMRRSNDGPSASRPRLRLDKATGEYVASVVDQAVPFFVLAGEYAPRADESTLSTLQRVLVLRWERQERKLIDDMERLVDDGCVNQLFAGYLRQVTRLVNSCAPDSPVQALRLHQAKLEQARSAKADQIEANWAFSTREARAAAVPLVGLRLLIVFGRAIGAIDSASARELHNKMSLSVLNAAAKHVRAINAPEMGHTEQVLEALRQAVASERFAVLGIPGTNVLTTGAVTVIGRYQEATKEQSALVAIFPAPAAAAIRRPQADLTQALRDIVLRGKDGNTKRVVRSDGGLVRALCVPFDIWTGDRASSTELPPAPQAQPTQPVPDLSAAAEAKAKPAGSSDGDDIEVVVG